MESIRNNDRDYSFSSRYKKKLCKVLNLHNESINQDKLVKDQVHNKEKKSILVRSIKKCNEADQAKYRSSCKRSRSS